MEVTHPGYKDPEGLKFEDIVVLGMPHPPITVTVIPGHVGNQENSIILPKESIKYDAAKKVKIDLITQLLVGFLHLKQLTHTVPA